MINIFKKKNKAKDKPSDKPKEQESTKTNETGGFRSNKHNSYKLSDLSQDLGKNVKKRVEKISKMSKISEIKELDNINFIKLDQENDIAIDLEFIWEHYEYKLLLAYKIASNNYDKAYPIPIFLIVHNNNDSVSLVNYDIFKDLEEIGLEASEVDEYLDDMIVSILENSKLYVTQLNKDVLKLMLEEAITQIAIINSKNFNKQIGK